MALPLTLLVSKVKFLLNTGWLILTHGSSIMILQGHPRASPFVIKALEIT